MGVDASFRAAQRSGTVFLCHEEEGTTEWRSHRAFLCDANEVSYCCVMLEKPPHSLRSLPAKDAALRSEVAAAQRRGMRAPEGPTAQTKNRGAEKASGRERTAKRSEAERSGTKQSERSSGEKSRQTDCARSVFVSDVNTEFGVPACHRIRLLYSQ